MRVIENKIFIINSQKLRCDEYEFVERKGIGHPDTLADALAEEISSSYSKYTLKNFGFILHHNFDKLGILGGQSFVKFGCGYLIKPIRVLINGRASIKFGDRKIPVEKVIDNTVRGFFKNRFPNLDEKKDIEIHYNLSTASSPGRTEENTKEENTRKYWFEPRGPHDLPYLKRLFSNDTSLGCSFWPFTKLENLVIRIESFLTSKKYRSENPWIGTDIKIMGTRIRDDIDITLCIPQIANYVNSLDDYKKNLIKVKEDIIQIIKKHFPNFKGNLNINTRDNFEKCEIYLTAIGSSIESGDEGLVGRGNRINGLITPCKPMSIEGACGKNPVYHVGKLYNIVAKNIAKKIYFLTKKRTEVYIISQSGRDLIDPWKTVVVVEDDYMNYDEILKIVDEEIKNIPKLTNDIINKKVRIY